MLTKFIYAIFIAAGMGVLCFKQTKNSASDISVTNLKTELLDNPKGIDTNQPRFSWNIESNEGNVYQQAYQIMVASTPELLSKQTADLWNSEKVTSGENLHIRYNGIALKSKQKCFWKVQVWTNKGYSVWSDSGYFSVGLQYYKDWRGRWIGIDSVYSWERVEKIPTMGARYLRKEFEVKKDVQSATAYIMGLGLSELYLNGEKVGDAVLAPAPTDYQKNIKYNTYDVTDCLTSGSNAIGVILGNGRFFTMRPKYKPYKIKHYGLPRLLFQMEINYKDGTKEVIFSSNQWKGTGDGPIRNNNEYDGEYYDARKEFGDWAKSHFDDSDWFMADYMQEPGGEYQAQMNRNMKVMKAVKPVSMEQKSPDTYLLDMGQNMVGWLKMNVSGLQGDKVTLRFAESLADDGSLFVTNLRDAQATDRYILKGSGVEVWEPRFTYHGFRYVEISGYPGTPTIGDFTGRVVYDEMKTVGAFTSSNQTINQIYNNAWWGISGNYKGMPVDCPQRNERQPWLGDRAVGAYGERFMFDNTGLYVKWLEDIEYAQKSDGSIPDVAPAYWNYYSDNMTWPGTLLTVADMIYQQTGDVQVIKDHYPAMKKWLGYMKDRYMTDEYIVSKDSYGDWCVPPPTIVEAVGQNADVKRPSELISTAYYYYFMGLMTRFARVIGQEEDAIEYQLLRSKLKVAFNQTFYHEGGYYGANTMTDQILPLYFGIVEQENESIVFNHLVRMIEEGHRGHLSTGMIGIQWLMRTLTKYGRSDIALKLATNTTYPSWGYMIEHGATTVWELWHGNVANPKMNSQNHVMLLGDLIIWYYESLAGIKAAEPGYRKITMKPEFNVNLDSVSASYRSVQGLVVSNWKKVADGIQWEITVPPNTMTQVYFPTRDENAITERLGNDNYQYLGITSECLTGQLLSGKYSFEIRQ